MSISWAPVLRHVPDLLQTASSGPRPLGNPPATLATFTPVPSSCSSATGTSCGYRQTAATGGIEWSSGFGRTAFAQIATILPTVSLPSSVVRSIDRIARSSAQSFASRLIERFASEAARSSSPTASTAVVRTDIRTASPAAIGKGRLGSMCAAWAMHRW